MDAQRGALAKRRQIKGRETVREEETSDEWKRHRENVRQDEKLIPIVKAMRIIGSYTGGLNNRHGTASLEYDDVSFKVVVLNYNNTFMLYDFKRLPKRIILKSKDPVKIIKILAFEVGHICPENARLVDQALKKEIDLTEQPYALIDKILPCKKKPTQTSNPPKEVSPNNAPDNQGVIRKTLNWLNQEI